MRTSRTTIVPPAPFDFGGVVRSHGWLVLAPNNWDAERQTLHRVEQLSSGQVVRLEIAAAGSVQEARILLHIAHDGALASEECQELDARVRHMLRLDEDLSEFYELCRRRGAPWDRVTSGLGRLMRSPTLFEDAVKTICTTNIQWSGTKRMVQELVDVYGALYPGDSSLRAFPTAGAIASSKLAEFEGRVRLGYRAAYVHELARQVATGELALEGLWTSSLPTPQLKKELLAIKGVGNYAAATLLMILGRYDELAIDTEFRLFVSNKYFQGAYPGDKAAKAVYEPWGRWRYLAYWFDLLSN